VEITIAYLEASHVGRRIYFHCVIPPACLKDGNSMYLFKHCNPAY